MPIVGTDLVFYGSQNMPTGDSGAGGGTINTGVIVIFQDGALPNALGPDTIRIESDNALDVEQIKIYGRSAAGVFQSESIVMSGVTPVTGVLSHDRLIMCDFTGATHTGTVQIRLGSTPFSIIGTMIEGVNTLRRPFVNCIANAAGGGDKSFFEQIFLRNNHATLTLTNAAVTGSASGLASIFGIAVHSGFGSNSTVADRLTAPTGMDDFDDNVHSIGDFSAGSGQSVWLRLDLDAGTAPQLDTYVINVSGNTT